MLKQRLGVSGGVAGAVGVEVDIGRMRDIVGDLSAAVDAVFATDCNAEEDG